MRLSLDSSRGGALDSEKDELSPIDPQLDVEQAKLPGQIPPVPTASDWTGPNDPENPLNWPAWFRHYHIAPPALISFTAYVFFPASYAS